jgi:two-component system CheB/CheR fusion protein
VRSFFRDAELFDTLEQRVLPRLFHRNADGDVRVWVAGCATGEDAYSVAMLLCERAADRPHAPRLQVFATYLHEQAIATARSGVYNEAEVAGLSETRLVRFFTREPGGYRVKRQLREIILFARHDVVTDAPFFRLDLVTCGNLLTSVDRSAQERIIERLHFSLRPGGLLLLGSSGSIDTMHTLFVGVDGHPHLYESRPGNLRMEGHTAVRIARAGVTSQGSEPGPLERLAPGELHHRLLEEYAPPSVVVAEDLSVVHVSARAGRFLRLQGGEPSRDLLKLIKTELRSPLRTALFTASKDRTNVVVRHLPLMLDGRQRSIDITVRPVFHDRESAKGFFLVLFRDGEFPAGEEPAPRLLDPGREVLTGQLEDELVQLRDQLKGTIERYAAQAEEAQMANEELQAANEELRSTADELEISKEELESNNEELATINRELEVKVNELRLSNDDIQNLIYSSDVATIFVDRQLRLKKITPRVRDILNLLASDIGRPLSDITSHLIDTDLDADLRLVLGDLSTVDREVQTRADKWFLMRIRPYRTVDDRIDGAVLTFQEVTEWKRAESALVQSEERLRLLVENAVDYAIFTMDDAGVIDSWNTGAQRLFGYEPEQIVGTSFARLFTQADRARRAPEAELRIAKRDGRAPVERLHERRDGTTFYCSGVTMTLGSGFGLAKIARDLTSLRQANEALRQANDTLEARVLERTRELRAEAEAHRAAKMEVARLLRQVVSAQEEERGRIARNLHDQLGQRITGLRLSLERARKRIGPDRELDTALELTSTLDSELGFLAWEIRPAALDHLGLAAALPRYVTEWSRHYDIEAVFDCETADLPMTADAETAFYRIAQEALNNVAKHAQASRVDVLLELRGETVVMVIEDNGVGFDASSPESRKNGIGLMGMEERAALIDAELQFESQPGRGAAVYLRYKRSVDTAKRAG